MDDNAVNEQIFDEQDTEQAVEKPACKSHSCPCKGKLALDNISAEDVKATCVTMLIMTAVTVLSVYAQYALTKWAVKSALKETRLR